MSKRSAILFAGILAAGMSSTTADGWVAWQCDGDKIAWDHDPTMRAGEVTFPAGNAYRTAITTVIGRWNDNPSNFQFELTYDEPTVALSNGQNEIWASDDDDVLDGAPAVSYTWDECGDWFPGNVEITEADVIFDSRRDWTSGTDKTVMTAYGGVERSFRTTAMHELGHALGIDHEDDEYNIMGEDWDHIHVNGSRATAYPGEDASDGAVWLYGLNADEKEDVGVVHWRYGGSDDGYSEHLRTRIFDEDGDELSKSTVSGEPRYRVNNGQEVRVEFTYENNGSSDQADVEVGFYLSTNSTISSWDERLEGRTFTLNRNSVYTTSRLITLPDDLDSDTDYYVGVIVDDDGEIDEEHELNNATYIRVRVN